MRQIWALSLAVLLAVLGWGLGSVGNCANALPVAASSKLQISQADGSAEALFRAAYANRYTWDQDFPGYRAAVSVRNGSDMAQGKAELTPDFKATVEQIQSQDIQQVVTAQLQMSATHLRRVPFDQIHQQRQFALTEVDPAGVASIQEIGDSARSHYKVKDRQIVQVNRTLGEMAVEVNTLAAHQTPEGYLTDHFQVIFRDAKTQDVLEQDDVRDTYSKIGDYYILTQRDIRFRTDQLDPQSPIDTQVQFTDIQLQS